MNIRSLVLHGWRSWQRARGIALLAVAALALGIGSTTAIYTLVQGVLLNPLPYADADRYYSVLGGWREPDVIRISPAPLYNNHEDVLRFALAAKEWTDAR